MSTDIARRAGQRGELRPSALSPARLRVPLQVGGMTARQFTVALVLINGTISAALLLGGVFPEFPLIVGVCCVLYLSVQAFVDPLRAFLMFIGTKMTFDMLYEVRSKELSLLEISLIPIIIMLAKGSIRWTRQGAVAVTLCGLYLAWVAVAMRLSDSAFRMEVLAKQSCMALGLLCGLMFMNSKARVSMALQGVFVSTLMPVLLCAVQVVLSMLGISVLNTTDDSIRGTRAAGAYYDAATSGMVGIVSLVAGAYLIRTLPRGSAMRWVCIVWQGLAVLGIIAGGTRSIIVTGAFVCIVLLALNLRRAILSALVVGTAVFIAWPSLESVQRRVESESRVEMKLSELLKGQEYQYMLSGRVGMWQKVMETVEKGTPLQQAFGLGQYAGAHSTYFLLLLEIGWLGLAFYLGSSVLIGISLFWARQEVGIALLSLSALAAFLLIGISASTIEYTTFQVAVYALVGAGLGAAPSSRGYVQHAPALRAG